MASKIEEVVARTCGSFGVLLVVGIFSSVTVGKIVVGIFVVSSGTNFSVVVISGAFVTTSVVQGVSRSCSFRFLIV